MIKLMLVDDQDILVEGLKLILGMEEDIEISGTANNGKKDLRILQVEYA